ncbi:MAG TPA: oligosaccharide flippase family protein [Candidatus Limnocylindrales bacterium]|nr:oligosaccharide flippase family protein [Candidatus Limnocylindrales bacterium]
MTLRGLLRGSLLYTLGNLLPRLGAFLLLPVYTAAMAPAEFGIFSLMLSLSGLLAIGYRLGLDGALLRLHFDVEPRRRPSLYLTMAAVTLAAAVGFSLLLALIAAPIFGAIFPGVAFLPFGLLALAITATTAFQYVPSSLFRATERPGRFLAFASSVFGVGVVATVIFLLVLDLGAAGALLGQLAGGLAMVAVAFLIVFRFRGRPLDRGLAREGLAFGLPLVPHGMASWVLSLSDRWLIGLFIGLPVLQAQAAVGIYSFGYVVAQAVSLVAMSFNAAWVPLFFARGDGPRGPSLLREVTTLSLGALGLLAVAIAVLAPEITDLLARARWGSDANAAADVMTVVALGFLLHGLYFMVVSAVFLRRRTAGLPLLTLAAGAANVTVNVLLIPRLGVMGAAWATVVGYAVLASATWWYAARSYELRLDLPRLAAIGLLAVALGLLSRSVTPLGSGVVLSGLAHLGLVAVYAAAAFPLLRGPLDRVRILLRDEPVPAVAAGTITPPKEHA